MKKLFVFLLCILTIIITACGGKRQANYGIVAYTNPVSPVSPYAPTELKIFHAGKGKVIGDIDLDLAEMVWDVDIATTPDLKYGLAATSKGVFIFEIAKAEIVGKLDWLGEVPQSGVDIAVTPDGTRGIVTHGTQVYPAVPYLPMAVTIFEIPSGNLIGDVDMQGKKIPWDVDIQITPDGKYGLVASTDQIIIFDTSTGNTLSIFDDKPGFVVPVGVDPVITKDGQTAIFLLSTERYLQDVYAGNAPAQFLPDIYSSPSIYFMDIPSGEIRNTIDLSAHACTWDVDIKLTPDGKYGLMPTSEGVQLFDVRDGALLTSIKTLSGQIPQVGSDLVVTPDGKTGLVAYGTQTYPPYPYMPVLIKIFAIPSGEEIAAVDLNFPYITMGIDITLTPNGKYALIPIDRSVAIVEVSSGELISSFETKSDIPQMGVDVTVTPDGRKGIIATGSMLSPPQPYLPVNIEIFSIPGGEWIADVDIWGGTIAWDVDIQINENGETGYILHDGYVTLFEIETGEVIGRIDLEGKEAHIGVDLVLTRPAINSPDEDEDFIPLYLEEQLACSITEICDLEERSRIIPPVEMPKRVTLRVDNAMLSHLTTLEKYYQDRPELFRDAEDHQEFIGGIQKAIDHMLEGNIKDAVNETAMAGIIINEHGMKDWINEYTVRDMIHQVSVWSESPRGNMVPYQPADTSSPDFLWYQSAMSKIHKEETFFSEVDQEDEIIIQVPEDEAVEEEVVEAAPASIAPVIKKFDFPAALKAEESGDGIVHFEDANGDIYLVQFNLMRSGCVTSDHFEFDPMGSLIDGDEYRGTFGFWQTCEKCSADSEDDIEMNVILYDRDGNTSEPFSYSFTCK